MGRLVNLGALRRNPNRPASVRTVANYRDCLLQVARRIAADGLELRDLTPESAVDYLASRTGDLGQKALDMHRQALQAMLVHVSRRLPEGERLTVLRSEKPGRRGGRAYTPQQVRMVAAAQRGGNASGNATLEALRDPCLSEAWTDNHLDLLARSCRAVRKRSFEQLARRAKEGRAL